MQEKTLQLLFNNITLFVNNIIQSVSFISLYSQDTNYLVVKRNIHMYYHIINIIIY